MHRIDLEQELWNCTPALRRETVHRDPQYVATVADLLAGPCST
jgi:hypothetical protein